MSEYVNKADRIGELLGLPKQLTLTLVSDGASNPIYLNDSRISGGKPRVGNTVSDKSVETWWLIDAIIPSKNQAKLMQVLEEHYAQALAAGEEG